MIYCASYDRRQHTWPVSGLPICSPAPRNSWISPACPSTSFGSHFSTVEALERHIDRQDIRLHFTTAQHSDAAFYTRLKALLDGVVPAANLLDIPHGPLRQIAEHHGMRLVLEGTFKRLDYFSVAIPETDIRRFVQAMRLAQDELDRRPDDYLHYLWREVPRLEKLFRATRRPAADPHQPADRVHPIRCRRIRQDARVARRAWPLQADGDARLRAPRGARVARQCGMLGRPRRSGGRRDGP